MNKKLVFGVGVNDAKYQVTKTEYLGGIRISTSICPFYSRWKDMLRRCYDSKYQAKKPLYIGCCVCEEWLTFSNFKAWMEAQDWNGRQLDKDLLGSKSKEYSPKNCCFISPELNSFISSLQSRDRLSRGVFISKGKYAARCHDPFFGKMIYLGSATSEIEAHNLWKKYKSNLAIKLADMEDDCSIATAIKGLYV